MISASTDFSLDKLIAALAYLAPRVDNFTQLRASKLLYFADKYHLTRYGRPIIGDRYVAMQRGPVPSLFRDLVQGLVATQKDMLEEDITKMSRFLSIDTTRTHPVIRARREPDRDQLSESDVEALDFAFRKYAHLTVTELINRSHQERAYKAAHHWMNYEDFFDPSDEEQLSLLAYALEVEETRETLDKVLG